MAQQRDCRPYKESRYSASCWFRSLSKYQSAGCHQRHHALGLLHWQCSWPLHVASAIQAAVCYLSTVFRKSGSNHDRYSNHVPWAVIGACYVVCPILLLVIRAVLVRENRIRDAEPVDDNEEEYVIERVTEDGKRVEVKVDKVRSPYPVVVCDKTDVLAALGIFGYDG